MITPKEITAAAINECIVEENAKGQLDTNNVSDGYHTFGELYSHRIALWIALCRTISLHNKRPPYTDFPAVWRSERHSDGELAYGGGWFVLGVYKNEGLQITYHLPMSEWDNCEFAETLDRAPEWDGHTSADVLERIKNL